MRVADYGCSPGSPAAPARLTPGRGGAYCQALHTRRSFLRATAAARRSRAPKAAAWRLLARGPARNHRFDTASALARAGAEVVPGDLGDPASLAKALEGCTAVFGLTN